MNKLYWSSINEWMGVKGIVMYKSGRQNLVIELYIQLDLIYFKIDKIVVFCTDTYPFKESCIKANDQLKQNV